VSAPAPALAKPERRTVTIRLADAAVTVGYLSLAFGLLLVFFPVSFPRIILHSWQNGQLIVAMMVLTLSLDAYLYLRVASLQSAKPAVLAAACLGFLPIMVVGGLSFLLQEAVAQTLAGDLPNLQARVGEEILAHTYLGLVSAVFLPFLVIRLLQPFKATTSDRRASNTLVTPRRLPY
jgi:hypothetical protein